MSAPVYKSEVFMPIQKDNQSFEERQRDLWDNVHSGSVLDDMAKRMEERRREWDHEVERMRNDFFRLKPMQERQSSSENLLENRNLENLFVDDVSEGDKRFCVRFDVAQFQAEEISVRTDDKKLLVEAKHDERGDGKNISREFSRSLDIPRHVNPNGLHCTLSKDGILQVEAPVTAPEYNKIRDYASQHAGQTILPAPLQMNSAPSLSSSPSPLMGSDFGVIRPTEFKPGTLVREQDGTKFLKMTVDVGSEFTPEDISVRTVDQKLQVRAKHEEKSAGRTSVREFSREFDLPADVDPNSVTASMTQDGKLIIEAPIGGVIQEGSYVGKPGSSKQPTVTLQLR